jgi:hypothetical protein
MSYIVHDINALRLMNADDDESMVIQLGVAQMENSGFVLDSVVPQFQTWDDQGIPSGLVGPIFIFRNSNG